MWRRVAGWLGGWRPAPHALEEIARHANGEPPPHRLWRHELSGFRAVLEHELPGVVSARTLGLRATVRIARWWVRRRGLELGLLECQEIRAGWLVGDFHLELAAEVRELARRVVLLRTEQQGSRDLERQEILERYRLAARREVLEELRQAALARTVAVRRAN